MKKFLSIFAALALVFTLAACGGETEDPKDPVDKKITIGANIYSGNDNFINGVVRPALDTAAKGAGATIEIVDSEGNQGKLNDQVDTFITKGVDVLVINLVEVTAAPTIIKKAKDANIPLILFNKESSNPSVDMAAYDKVWYVGTDSKESGIIQGDLIAADLKANPDWDKNGDGTIQYVMLQGEPGHPDAEARTEYSVKQIEAAGIKVEKLGHEKDPNWSTQFGRDTVNTWLSAPFGKDIELIIANNDGMAFGAIEALKAEGVKIPVYGVDALEQALDQIESGEMNGTVLNDGVNQAKATIDLAVNVAKGNEPTAGTSWKLTTDGSKAVRVAYVGVNKENVADFR